MRFSHIVTCVDTHTVGEAMRIAVSGFPQPQGATMLARKQYAQQHLDWLRRLLLAEPRGHSGMCGCLLTEAQQESADLGVIFMNSAGFSSFCGHGMLAVLRACVETGRLPAKPGHNHFVADTPAGLTHCRIDLKDGRVTHQAYESAPAYVFAENVTLWLQGVGEVAVDIAFGASFYAYLDAARYGIDLALANRQKLIRMGMEIKEKLVQMLDFPAPGLNGVVFTGPVLAEQGGFRSTNACIFGQGQIDRSPTGTASAGRVALLHRQGALRPGDVLRHESLFGAQFHCRLLRLCQAEDKAAVVVEVAGRSFITGFNQLVCDEEDEVHGSFT